MNSDRNGRTTDNVSQNDELKLILVKSIFLQIVEAPIRHTPVCHTPLTSATEPLLEWFFKIPFRYHGSSNSVTMITLNYYPEISEVMRLEVHYFSLQRVEYGPGDTPVGPEPSHKVPGTESGRDYQVANTTPHRYLNYLEKNGFY